MTNNITSYYEGARLSEAAYADFSSVMAETDNTRKRQATIAALTANGWSETQATAFADKYEKKVTL